MKTYEPGKANVKDLNDKLREYRQIEHQIEDAIRAKQRELERIEAAKNKLAKRATYAPTQEALDYWARNFLKVAQQPAPIHGGPVGLRRAAREIEAHDAKKKQAA